MLLQPGQSHSRQRGGSDPGSTRPRPRRTRIAGHVLALRGVAAVQEEEGSGDALQEERHILAAHGGPGQFLDFILTEQFLGDLAQLLRHFGIVDERRGTVPVVVELGGAFMPSATVFAISPMRLARYLRMSLLSARTVPSMKQSLGMMLNAEPAWTWQMEMIPGSRGSDFAADDGLDFADDVGGDADGVDGVVRLGAVGSLPLRRC